MCCAGIQDFGIVEASNGVKVYAYEVDGLGNSLVDFDDPNIPSLLSVPLLGYSGYDKEIFENTKERILSHNNRSAGVRQSAPAAQLVVARLLETHL